MKKAGFTLSEVLISMTIIGVVAAISMPALSNIFPDRNKAKVLKYQALIASTISEMLDDDTICHPRTSIVSGARDTYVLTRSDGTRCEGLTCLEIPFLPEFRDNRFLPQINDASQWVFTDNGDNTYRLQVVTDNRTSKLYSPGDTKNINTFLFDIDEHGDVTAGDPLTDAFLNNPKKLNDRINDLEQAAIFNRTRTY